MIIKNLIIRKFLYVLIIGIFGFNLCAMNEQKNEQKYVEGNISIVPNSLRYLRECGYSKKILKERYSFDYLESSYYSRAVEVIVTSEERPKSWSDHGCPLIYPGYFFPRYLPVTIFKNLKEGDVIEWKVEFYYDKKTERSYSYEDYFERSFEGCFDKITNSNNEEERFEKRSSAVRLILNHKAGKYGYGVPFEEKLEQLIKKANLE